MHQLARLTIGRLRLPIDDPQSPEFADTFGRIRSATESADGFVWCNNDADAVPSPTAVVNLTVWKSHEFLESFVWGPVNRPFLLRRSDWFEEHDGPHEVVWWVSALRQPTLPEAIDRLQALRQTGPTLRAFTLGDRFPPN